MEKILETFLAFVSRYPRLQWIADAFIKWLFENLTGLDERRAPMWADTDADAYADVT